MTGLFHCIHCRSLQGVCHCSRFTFLPPGDEKEIRSYQNHVLLLSASGLFTICQQKQQTCSKSLILVMEDTCTTHQGITGLCCMQHTNAHIIFSFQQQKLFFFHPQENTSDLEHVYKNQNFQWEIKWFSSFQYKNLEKD